MCKHTFLSEYSILWLNFVSQYIGYWLKVNDAKYIFIKLKKLDYIKFDLGTKNVLMSDLNFLWKKIEKKFIYGYFLEDWG